MSIKGKFAGSLSFTRSNPDYLALLTAIANETDPVLKEQLYDKIQFTAPLSRDEQQLFEYVNFDYIENNPGYVQGGYGTPVDSGLYVVADYVVDGYINIQNTNVGLYVEAGYVVDDYVAAGAISGQNESGWIAYAGVYYNQNGETT